MIGASTQVRLAAESIEDLPRLAWCVRLRAGASTVELRCGPWVEVAGKAFVAGAWDGSFSAMQFGHSAALCGSGAVVEKNSVLFATAFHPTEWLFANRVGDCLWISNSLPFVLTASEDELDLTYPNYFFDLLNDYRMGVEASQTGLITKASRTVRIFSCCSFRVAADLSISREEKKWKQPPESYQDYADELSRSVNAILDNARSRDRTRPYQPIATVSRGYDSTASAALAAGGGCQQAVTFRQSRKDAAGTLADDSGAAVARDLSMTVTEYDRADYRDRPLGEAEFFMTPMGRTNLSLLAMEDELSGSVLVGGRHGENFWRRDGLPVFPNFREPSAVKMSGSEAIEFCLRAGIIHLPAPYLQGIHGAAIRQITHAKEMQPWSLGGTYDRPIPRRIAEEAGVRRNSFGQLKMGGGERGDPLSEDARRDFEEFWIRTVGKGRPRDSGRPNIGRRLRRASRKLRRWTVELSPIIRRLAERYPIDRFHPAYGSPALYRFHWGVWRASTRYRAGAESFRTSRTSPLS